MARPTFLIVGAFKCGTTSLHHYLMQHPDIQMAAMKETNFFSGPPNGVPYATGERRIKDLDEYEALFDPGIKARGEASPNYTLHPLRPGTPERIKETIPDAKLLYLVRDPVVRTVSHYHHYISTMGERRSLEDALGDFSETSPYLSASFYGLQLEQYLRHFREEQVMVVDQTDLYTQRHATLRAIFAFLSVDDTFVSPRFGEELNTREHRRTYSSFMVVLRRARATPLQRLPRGFRLAMRHSAEKLVSRPLDRPTLSDDLMRRLQDLYADDVSRFRQLTGKAFPTWSI